MRGNTSSHPCKQTHVRRASCMHIYACGTTKKVCGKQSRRIQSVSHARRAAQPRSTESGEREREGGRERSRGENQEILPCKLPSLCVLRTQERSEPARENSASITIYSTSPPMPNAAPRIHRGRKRHRLLPSLLLVEEVDPVEENWDGDSQQAALAVRASSSGASEAPKAGCSSGEDTVAAAAAAAAACFVVVVAVVIDGACAPVTAASAMLTLASSSSK